MSGGKKYGVAAAVAVAILMGSAAAVAAKEDVNARRVDGSTPLQWATFAGDVAESKRLIAAGADVKATNNYGVSPMLLAADIASTELIQLLLKNGADASSANPDGETALHLVVRAGNIDAAKLLLKGGAKVDAREKLGEQTPLMWAVARRHPAMVEFLLSHGADVNARSAIRDYQRVATAESRAKSLDRGGLTPLLYAARENCRECVEILLKHGADVNLPDPSRVVPVVIAMLNGNFDIAKRLVEAGADVNQWDIYGQSPLHVAIAGGGRSNNPLDADFPQKATGPELVQMLIDRGANPNQQTYFRPAVRGGGGRGTTPFLVAVGTGNIDLVKQLIAKGANVKLSTSEGTGAIHAAAQARGGGGGAPGGGGGPPVAAPPVALLPAVLLPAALMAAMPMGPSQALRLQLLLQLLLPLLLRLRAQLSRPASPARLPAHRLRVALAAAAVARVQLAVPHPAALALLPAQAVPTRRSNSSSCWLPRVRTSTSWHTATSCSAAAVALPCIT